MFASCAWFAAAAGGGEEEGGIQEGEDKEKEGGREEGGGAREKERGRKRERVSTRCAWSHVEEECCLRVSDSGFRVSGFRFQVESFSFLVEEASTHAQHQSNTVAQQVATKNKLGRCSAGEGLHLNVRGSDGGCWCGRGQHTCTISFSLRSSCFLSCCFLSCCSLSRVSIRPTVPSL